MLMPGRATATGNDHSCGVAKSTELKAGRRHYIAAIRAP